MISNYTKCFSLVRNALKSSIAISIFVLLIHTPCYSIDTKKYSANSVEVSKGEVTLYNKESVFFGISCATGTVGIIKGLNKISIGDVVEFEGFKMKVGLIEAEEYLEDYQYRDLISYKKGDITCVIAQDLKSLPYDDDCDALWILVKGCKALY